MYFYFKRNSLGYKIPPKIKSSRNVNKQRRRIFFLQYTLKSVYSIFFFYYPSKVNSILSENKPNAKVFPRECIKFCLFANLLALLRRRNSIVAGQDIKSFEILNQFTFVWT